MKFNIVDRGDENSKKVAIDLKQRLEKIGWIYDSDHFLMLFSIGGDGTLLRSIHTYIDKIDSIQFLAIHTGTLGFFTDYTQNELDQLISDLQINPYNIDSYPLLEMKLPQVNDKLYALNEVRIESLSKTLALDIYIDNEFFESTRGSGICVSTQIGSTGVNRALKGAVIDPGLRVLELCEIMPISHKDHHSLKNPYIMQESRQITVKGDTLSFAHVCYDHLERNLDSISEIHICQSNKKVRFARYRTYSYLKRLKNLY